MSACSLFFVTQDYVSVFYPDSDNAEASDAGQIVYMSACSLFIIKIMFRSFTRIQKLQKKKMMMTSKMKMM